GKFQRNVIRTGRVYQAVGVDQSVQTLIERRSAQVRTRQKTRLKIVDAFDKLIDVFLRVRDIAVFFAGRNKFGLKPLTFDLIGFDLTVRRNNENDIEQYRAQQSQQARSDN